ncbi:Ephrin type-B receptor 3 (Fragment) [Seminavis robusta]|uniref:Ephrin type-B receptor 3 n=1 Tax=Seminavis robusta TaxID=568900 RepID=A0A9N8DC91_9STRA
MRQNSEQQQQDQDTLPTTSLSSSLGSIDDGGTDEMRKEGRIPVSTIYTTNGPAWSLPRDKRTRKRRYKFIGGIFAVSLSAAVLLDWARCRHIQGSCDKAILLPWISQLYPKTKQQSRAILDFLDIFWLTTNTSSSIDQAMAHNHPTTTKMQQRTNNHLQHSSSIPRHLLGSTGSGDSTASHYPQLVVAGKMTVEDGPCNIAQYNLKSQEWSLTQRIQLSLYNSYSGGEVYSLLANHTFLPFADSEEEDDDTSKRRPSSSSSTSRQFEGSGELIVVGAFDTTYRNSQVTYCSVGEWNGKQLSKVGEGLCNSALSKGMKITTSALAGPYDVFVAGSFQTQVWNGDRHEFVKIFNIAHFNALDQVWLPLKVGQITCSWCTVTVLALAWDSKRRQLHVAGKFNAIDGRNVPAGLAIYDVDSGHLVAHPGGGLTMKNQTQDGVGTALQLDEERGVLYVMGSFERLTATGRVCLGLAAFEIKTNRWTCLADSAHTVLPTGGGNMLLTQHGLMVAGQTATSTTWPDASRPYTIALLKATLKTEEKRTKKKVGAGDDDSYVIEEEHTQYHDFNWSWLPGFSGHDEPLHALSNGFADYEGTVFIAGDNLVAKWSYQLSRGSDSDGRFNTRMAAATTSSQSSYVPVTEVLSGGHIRGSIMAISQMMPEPLAGDEDGTESGKLSTNVSIIVYGVAVGCVIGMFLAILCNRNRVFPFLGKNSHLKGISLDMLTYSALENSNITDAYQRAMKVRYVQHPHLLTIIDPQEIFLQRIIGEGTFGRVWSARWSTASVAVKEFVFAQAAVAGKSSMQQEIVEEIIGEAGMMAILRHPNVLQLFGCSLTAQAIWIVSELCSLGSLRQVLDDNDRVLPVELRLNLALQVAEGMAYLHNQDPPIIHRDLKSHNIFVHETFTDTPTDAPRKRDRSWRKKGGEDDDNKQQQQGRGDAGERTSLVAKPETMKTKFTLVAKIGDWGSARATLSGSRTMTHGVGTACWLAPEVIKHARSSKYSDVYGYGIVLWELATREEVYQGLETTQIIAKVANESLRPPVPQDCPWKELMVKCWEENPLDRLEFTEIVQQLGDVAKWLAECNEERSKDGSKDGSDKTDEKVDKDRPTGSSTTILTGGTNDSNI